MSIMRNFGKATAEFGITTRRMAKDALHAAGEATAKVAVSVVEGVKDFSEGYKEGRRKMLEEENASEQTVSDEEIGASTAEQEVPSEDSVPEQTDIPEEDKQEQDNIE